MIRKTVLAAGIGAVVLLGASAPPWRESDHARHADADGRPHLGHAHTHAEPHGTAPPQRAARECRVSGGVRPVDNLRREDQHLHRARRHPRPGERGVCGEHRGQGGEWQRPDLRRRHGTPSCAAVRHDQQVKIGDQVVVVGTGKAA